ncbi:tRNA threonylcarbamoyladenosine biosynthesis protein TsaB [Roseovarius sp. THAF27]|uniref:tRNA (adenosine(37)-N6)-threonylcarbamoyltransferase complex dimerization subunit type 1 TsaB n=1 Tax=unclassified Roseovarius TaxID=2614913 RepID=UPI001267C5A1|nr:MULTISPECIES: tRNA (adenosine(37)-N6)-threonylcarbamoyltransferase complex dimerization subunit type 1 TsaB [unclassified Roseovarius]QFT82565.1 tRNA threonylcarbamoyladenosine biosynthesis protein TsaB [Roseovarius sp. THAF27]
MTDARRVLAFDTSGPWLGVCLLSGQGIVAESHVEMPKGQAEALFPALEETLDRAGAAWGDLDAIGVGIGPGNFTGIRISVSAARGLALSLDVPAVGVSILEAAAFGLDGPILSVRDAPRDQVYAQGFGLRRAFGPKLVPLDEVSAEIFDANLQCVGAAAEPVAARIGAQALRPLHDPATAIALIAASRLGEPVPPPAPLYLKPADAAPSRDVPPVILDDA